MVDSRAVPLVGRWHERDTLVDGAQVGRLGSLWYLLNEDDRPISSGFHEIIPRGKIYEGRIATTTMHTVVVYGEIAYDR